MMEEYITELKKLIDKFSYQKFLDLLKKIDSNVNEGNNLVFSEEFIYYFKQLINLVSDDYLVNNNPGTLGHLLVETTLIKKEKLTPSLILCFILEQKRKINLDEYCNEIAFTRTRHMTSDFYRMAVVSLNDIELSYMSINWQEYYKKANLEVDEFNYSIMRDVLHELTHVYQLSKSKNNGNAFERLARYDYEIAGILNRHISNITIPIFHESLVCEFMADEQARAYLIHTALKHPEYFNYELIERELRLYTKVKTGVYTDKFDSYMYDVRVRFDELKKEIKKIHGSLPELRLLFDTIDKLEKESKPLIDKLSEYGISEKGEDNYYSIYLNSLYHFDNNKIILVDKPTKKQIRNII